MKRFMMATLLSATLGVGLLPVQANEKKMMDPKEQAQMLDKKMEKLTKELTLTGEQQTQIRSVLQTKMDKKRQAAEEANLQIRSLLTPTQVGKYNDMKD